MTGISDSEWDAFVESHPDATLFHRSAWRRLAKDVFGHTPYYLAVRANGSLSAVLPLVEIRSRLFGHALISNAFCVGGGPLASDDDARTAILEQAEHLGRRLKVDYVELRDTPKAAPGWTSRDDLYASFEGPLPTNTSQIPAQKRNQLNRALKKNLAITVEHSTRAFYPIYAHAMRDHGTPALPRKFFERLLALFGEDCEIMVARAEGRPVAAILYYFFKERLLSYYAPSLPDARPLQASSLLFWSMMQRAQARGCSVFDLGRSKVGSGPYKFKQEWGLAPRPVVNQYRLIGADAMPNVNPSNPKYALLIKSWQRLPVFLATAISPPLSRVLA